MNRRYARIRAGSLRDLAFQAGAASPEPSRYAIPHLLAMAEEDERDDRSRIRATHAAVRFLNESVSWVGAEPDRIKVAIRSILRPRGAQRSSPTAAASRGIPTAQRSWYPRPPTPHAAPQQQRAEVSQSQKSQKSQTQTQNPNSSYSYYRAA